jgi:hypothetical protein
VDVVGTFTFTGYLKRNPINRTTTLKPEISLNIKLSFDFNSDIVICSLGGGISKCAEPGSYPKPGEAKAYFSDLFEAKSLAKINELRDTYSDAKDVLDKAVALDNARKEWEKFWRMRW